VIDKSLWKRPATKTAETKRRKELVEQAVAAWREKKQKGVRR